MSRGHVSETDLIQSGAILGYLEMSTVINCSGYYGLLKAMSPAQFQLILLLLDLLNNTRLHPLLLSSVISYPPKNDIMGWFSVRPQFNKLPYTTYSHQRHNG